MMTVITETTLEAGQEAEWDQAFQERLAAARQQPGWIGVQVLIPEGEPQKRVIVGTWESQEAWARWHEANPFRETRRQLDTLDRTDGQERWFTVASVATARD